MSVPCVSGCAHTQPIEFTSPTHETAKRSGTAGDILGYYLPKEEAPRDGIATEAGVEVSWIERAPDSSRDGAPRTPS